jgi:hypothetical protein
MASSLCRLPQKIRSCSLCVTVQKSIDIQHRERAPGVRRRSLAAYLSPPGPCRCSVGGGPSRLQGCGTVTCSPARRPYRPECWPCGIRSGWPRRCWHDGGRRARRCRLGADRAQQGSTVAGAAAVADPPPARQGRGTAGPQWWPPIWRARPYRARWRTRCRAGGRPRPARHGPAAASGASRPAWLPDRRPCNADTFHNDAWVPFRRMPC